MHKSFAANLRDKIYGASRVLNSAGIVILMAMMLMIVADVLMRNLFNKPLQGSFELVEFMMAVMMFCFFANGQIEKGHVAVEMIVNRLPNLVRRVLAIVNYAIATVFFALMTMQMFRESYAVFVRKDASPSLQIPDYPFMFGASIGAFFLTLVLIVDLLVALLNVKPDENA